MQQDRACAVERREVGPKPGTQQLTHTAQRPKPSDLPGAQLEPCSSCATYAQPLTFLLPNAQARSQNSRSSHSGVPARRSRLIRALRGAAHAASRVASRESHGLASSGLRARAPVRRCFRLNVADVWPWSHQASPRNTMIIFIESSDAAAHECAEATCRERPAHTRRFRGKGSLGSSAHFGYIVPVIRRLFV